MSDLNNRLDEFGLLELGRQSFEAGLRILVGNAGSRFWPVFSQSAEFTDGKSDPLDRWSKRVGTDLAKRLGARVVFPFEGPPYPPFLEWASSTGLVSASPIAIHIHRDQGLWHAYRFAMEFGPESGLSGPDGNPEKADASPCQGCPDKPCLQTCPVDAFVGGHYDVHTCMNYLHSNPASDCVSLGCAARRACPVSTHNHYLPEHAQFHMNAFMRQKI